MDHLSGLFSMINTVCQEQFSIIRAVFPTHTIAKVTRMLIQRIFNDLAFGIQARVDSILCPAPLCWLNGSRLMRTEPRKKVGSCKK